MKTAIIKYIYLILIILTIGFVLGSCGGDNSGSSPNINSNPTNSSSLINPSPTPVLSNVSVSGYIFANNIVTDEGETISSINILDVPAFQSNASGNEPFVTQVANSLKEDYPEDWAKAEIQELYAQLNKTLSESKPLSEINGQVYSVYADSQSATPIPVGSDGHFDNTVLTGAADSTVKLEVALGEDNYTEVETIASSDNIISSDSTNAVLKSCPEKIFAFPGEIVIFKVYSEPGINLKSAGLKFTLNNPSIGCITQPVYLCVFGAHKYQVAYGCLYIKNGLNTPVDTMITAKTNNGLTLNIFTEVIKKTSSISGTVYTGGMPLVKGFVHSLGPKACCKLDSNGAYTLPKVFRGHGRAVIATWWTIDENGKKIRHREEKIIDFFSSDLTEFNFGVLSTPTPTMTSTFTPNVTPTRHPPEEYFYSKQLGLAIMYYNDWEKQVGREAAMQKTVDWINRIELSEAPPPECMVKAYIEGNDITVEFNDGMICFFETVPRSLNVIPDITPVNQKFEKSFKKAPLNSYLDANSPKTCFDPNIIILSPMSWQFDRSLSRSVQYDLVNLLETFNYYNITNKITARNDIDFDLEHPIISYSDKEFKEKYAAMFKCNLSFSGLNNQDNLVTPWDYEKITDYGLVYIFTHGGGGLFACIAPLNHLEVYNWIGDKPCSDGWKYGQQFLNRNELIYLQNYKGDPNDYKYQKGGYIPVIYLRKDFFTKLNAKAGENFRRSIVYISACHSYELEDAFSNAGVYFGYDGSSQVHWQSAMSFYLFYYMFFHHVEPNYFPHDQEGYPIYDPMEVIGDPPYPNDIPLSAQESYDILDKYYKVNHWPFDCVVQLCIGGSTDKLI
jgi:hypothetical protein